MVNLAAYIILFLFANLVVTISLCQPEFLSNNNAALANFFDNQFINVLGVIVALTVASASSISLELRKMEAAYAVKDGFSATRLEVQRGAFALIHLFLFSFLLVIFKKFVSDAGGKVGEALIHGSALFLVFWNVMILFALMKLAFKIGPIHLKASDQ